MIYNKENNSIDKIGVFHFEGLSFFSQVQYLTNIFFKRTRKHQIDFIFVEKSFRVKTIIKWLEQIKPFSTYSNNLIY